MDVRERRTVGNKVYILAWFLWRTIYLAKLPGLEKKLRVALDWTLDLIFSKDFVEYGTETAGRVARRQTSPVRRTIRMRPSAVRQMTTGTLLRGARMMCYKERAVGIARIKLSVSESSTRRRTESGVT